MSYIIMFSVCIFLFSGDDKLKGRFAFTLVANSNTFHILSCEVTYIAHFLSKVQTKLHFSRF